MVSEVSRWVQADPRAAGNSVLGLGFAHRRCPCFPGGGRWGRMALHSHSGAPAAHVPRLLADGVGAGSKRDRHGHRGRGKGGGRTAISSWGRGGRTVAFALVTALSFSPSTVSLEILDSLGCARVLSLLPRSFVLFSEGNVLSRATRPFLTLALPRAKLKQTHEQEPDLSPASRPVRPASWPGKRRAWAALGNRRGRPAPAGPPSGPSPLQPTRDQKQWLLRGPDPLGREKSRFLPLPSRRGFSVVTRELCGAVKTGLRHPWG